MLTMYHSALPVTLHTLQQPVEPASYHAQLIVNSVHQLPSVLHVPTHITSILPLDAVPVPAVPNA
jgi:hypothetical protein